MEFALVFAGFFLLMRALNLRTKQRQGSGRRRRR